MSAMPKPRTLAEFLNQKLIAEAKKAKRRAKGALLWSKRFEVRAGQRFDPRMTTCSFGTTAKLLRDFRGPRKRIGGKTDRQRQIAKLDALWSLAIKLAGKRNYGPMCAVCVTNPGTTACHKVPKQRGFAVRWRLDNGYLGCAHCNLGEVMNRSLYREIHCRIFGREQIEMIEKVAATKVQYSMPDMKEIEATLKSSIERR